MSCTGHRALESWLEAPSQDQSAGAGAGPAAACRTCCTCGAVLPRPKLSTLGASASMLELQAAAKGSWQSCEITGSGAPQDKLPRIRTRQCTSPVPAPAAAHGWGDEAAAGAAAEPGWRQRSVTPVDLPGAQQGSGGCDCGPITPAAAPIHAAVTPNAVAKTAAIKAVSPAAAAGAATMPAAQGDAAQAAQHAASAAALWRRIQSFMQCVAVSPLLQSALLSLELGVDHPVAAEPGMPASEALQWTLAQLLAMHLKAGHAEASEHTVLASLWLLESVESVRRSPATVCLNDYLKHLAVFSPEAVLQITADWKRSFRELRQAVVDAQADLLVRLDWLVHLDLASEVKPCLDLLFQLPRGSKQAMEEEARGDPSPAFAREVWALRMHRICSYVQQQAHHLRKPARPSHRRPQQGEMKEEAQLMPTKRQRVQCIHS